MEIHEGLPGQFFIDCWYCGKIDTVDCKTKKEAETEFSAIGWETHKNESCCEGCYQDYLDGALIEE